MSTERTWQLRCTTCGRTRDARAAGLIRLGARSIGKRTIGWCRTCRALRFAAIEPRREDRQPFGNIFRP